jgi:hypothetical protein
MRSTFCSMYLFFYKAGLDDRRIGIRPPAGAENFLFAAVSKLALGLTYPPTEWQQRLFSWGQSGRVETLTNLPRLVWKVNNDCNCTSTRRPRRSFNLTFFLHSFCGKATNVTILEQQEPEFAAPVSLQAETCVRIQRHHH